MLQDFKSVSDHFGTLCIKGLKLEAEFIGVSNRTFIFWFKCSSAFYKIIHL